MQSINGVAPQALAEELESLDAVLRRTACKRSTIYAWIAQGLFPPPVRIGPRRVAWRTRDVNEWMANAVARGKDQREKSHS